MRALILTLILTILAALPALAQEKIDTSASLPSNGLTFGHARFAGDVRPGISATWSNGKNASFSLGAGGSPGVNETPASLSGSVGLTIRF